MPGKSVNMPSTLRRSPRKAQRTYAKTRHSAEQTYGSGERAARTAYAALKHSFEKVGDHWEPKDHKGPSDEQARHGGPDKQARTYGGVDVEGHSRKELQERARDLGVSGTSRMKKEELAAAIARKQ